MVDLPANEKEYKRNLKVLSLGWGCVCGGGEREEDNDLILEYRLFGGKLDCFLPDKYQHLNLAALQFKP